MSRPGTGESGSSLTASMIACTDPSSDGLEDQPNDTITKRETRLMVASPLVPEYRGHGRVRFVVQHRPLCP